MARHQRMQPPGPPPPGPPPRPGPPASSGPPPRRRSASLLKSTGSIAIATLISRVTGFGSKVLLASVVGFGVLNDSYTVANTLPNIIYELLLGGVLTSVVVPLLVRAAREDRDGGLAYTQRLVTVAFVLLAFATLAAVSFAPLLTRLYLGDGDAANPHLATAFAYLLLPEIIFYGMGALFGAVLNAHNRFGAPAWAPVLNNLVVIITLGAYAAAPGNISLDPVEMGDTKLLILGIGTTLGIAVQATVMIPALKSIGFTFRWRWGWDARLSQAGRMVLWVVGYVLISQIGLIATTRAASHGDSGGIAIYSYAWLLFQLPYGVLGVSLLTAIMPRMSRAAAAGDYRAVTADLSVGSRYSAMLLVPIAVVMSIAGQSLGIALFSFGNSDTSDAARLGSAIAVSAFGLVPYAITMLQLRVFYAMADARTPTMIMLWMTVVKVPLLLGCPAVLDDRDIVLGLSFVNAGSFVLGAIMGQVLLRRRLGLVRTTEVLETIGKCAIAAIPASGVALIVQEWVRDDTAVGAWADLIVTTSIVGTIMVLGLVLLRTTEMEAGIRAVRNRISRTR